MNARKPPSSCASPRPPWGSPRTLCKDSPVTGKQQPKVCPVSPRPPSVSAPVPPVRQRQQAVPVPPPPLPPSPSKVSVCQENQQLQQQHALTSAAVSSKPPTNPAASCSEVDASHTSKLCVTTSVPTSSTPILGEAAKRLEEDLLSPGTEEENNLSLVRELANLIPEIVVPPAGTVPQMLAPSGTRDLALAVLVLAKQVVEYGQDAKQRGQVAQKEIERMNLERSQLTTLVLELNRDLANCRKANADLNARLSQSLRQDK